MTRTVIACVILLALGGGAVWLAVGGDGGGRATSSTNASGPSFDERFPDSRSCQPCHQEVFDEWKDSQHAIAFVNPLVRREDMADGFRKKDCIPCHAPRPVFEAGLGKSARVLTRETARAEGVDCLSCHRAGDGVAASRPGLTGACNPVFRAELTSTDLCAPCHNQHNTIDEWEASAPTLRGANCNHCHMPEVDRPATATRPARKGRSHASHGGKDATVLASAATVDFTVGAAQDGSPVLDVVLTNSGCAHNFPTDARHRAVDLVVQLLGAQGEYVGPTAKLGPGEEGGNARLRLRNPYRDEFGKTNTQLASGQSTTLRVPLVPGATSAEIRVLMKRTPFLSDAEAHVVTTRTAKW
ncbi:MAG: hypothetical protein IPH13_13080 [Planctomycetes bacterium]|nr:hypothetical protein [Planctomycetota bacterium]MCC7172913.1 hypothetical protein [Planctomycetota bacterium]